MQLGKTPLHDAADKGHIAIAALLVEKGADVNAMDDVSGDSVGVSILWAS